MLRTTNSKRPTGIEDLLDSELIARLDPLDLASRKVFAGKLRGERRSKRRGQSVEFADHRPYVVGDDLRHIDWNIFGRLDRLFLKLFLEEEDLALHVVIDASESSDCGEPSKFAHMQRSAMALGYVGLVNLNRVACTIMGGARGGVPRRVEGGDPGVADEPADLAVGPGEVSAVRDLRGRRRTHDLARFICASRPSGPLLFRSAAERIALMRRGKGVMVILSDFMFKDGYEDGLRLLVGRGYDVFAIQVLSPQEIDPSIVGDLRLRDVEDGDAAEVTVSQPLLKRYKANLDAYTDGLRDYCARREITYLRISSATPVDTLILDLLRRKGLVR
ncbi:MAG: DUF58 domain-containing protein [Phycisphaeraceae bacterium]|nr:DUF58 domain-containing protein [Phycisphaerae bacterium]MBX3393260.1 DUF58 domain-containing protein [Phycisphaeraceae bacterium]